MKLGAGVRGDATTVLFHLINVGLLPTSSTIYAAKLLGRRKKGTPKLLTKWPVHCKVKEVFLLPATDSQVFFPV